MKTIRLTKGYVAKVDNELYSYLSQWNWYYNSGHAERKESRRHVLMHRVVIDAPEGSLVDHINGDRLDNRRGNLRIASHSTNAMNMRKHRGASRYKGVSKNGKYWRVQIWKDNRKAFTATAPSERAAAMIYDLNAPLLFGDYARLNFAAETVRSGGPSPQGRS
jgi:hypothetical protein